MKKILFWTAVTILAAVSCNKIENDAPVQESSNVPYFEAYVDGVDAVADTKTVIENMVSYWNGEEKIWVLNGEENGDWKKEYVANVEKSDKATFEATNSTLLSGNDYMAIYPMSPASNALWKGDISNQITHLWLVDNQAATEGSYDPQSHIAIAYTKKDDLNLYFKNVTALVKIEIPYDNVTKVCFRGNNNETISGNFNVLYNDGDPKVSTPSGDNIQLNPSAFIEGNLKKGSIYYISILPGVFEKGFSIDFVIDGITYTKKNSKKYSVARNQVISLPEVKFDLPENQTLKLKPNKTWKGKNGYYAAYCWIDNGPVMWRTLEDSNNDGIYEGLVPNKYTKVIFVCLKANTSHDFTNKHIQTANLTIDSSKCYVIHSGQTDKGDWFTPTDASKLLYLNTGSAWYQGNERFAAYFFNNSTGKNTWVGMKKVTNQIHYVLKQDNYPNIIFCRMNGSQSANDWNNKWDQTDDLTVPSDAKTTYSISSSSNGKGSGSWSEK